uniref:Vipericidin n=1 Tax=Salvator merianae TaxID=96440 RepID=A0A8D0DUC5_SALMN
MKSSSWGILLLAGLAAASATLPTQKPPLTFEKMVELAVGLYNQKSGENSTFKLLKASPQPSWDASSELPQKFNVTIKATECQTKEKDSEEKCGIQDGKVVKQCSGYFFPKENPPMIVMSCEEAGEKEEEKKDKNEEVRWRPGGSPLRQALDE